MLHDLFVCSPDLDGSDTVCYTTGFMIFFTICFTICLDHDMFHDMFVH
jgi:hypothetical protein